MEPASTTSESDNKPAIPDWLAEPPKKTQQPAADWQEDPKGKARAEREWQDDPKGNKRPEREWQEDPKDNSRAERNWQETPPPAKRAIPAEPVTAPVAASQATPKPAPKPAPKVAAPKPAAKKAAAKPSGPRAMTNPRQQSKAIAETVVGSFVERLKAEAMRKGGHLSVADIDSMQAEFDQQAAALQTVFEQSFEVYVKARERASWDQARHFPFDRLIVKKFSHLFKATPGPTTVSRRMLPGFFMAISMMLGPDVVESYQERCRMIVERIRDGQEDFDWEDVYTAEETGLVTIAAQVTVVQHFEDFAKRAEWFINLVNGHLSPPGDSSDEAALNWEMTEAGFQRFLDALLKDLRDAVTDDAGRKKVAKRHGAAAVERVIAVLRALDAYA